MKRLLAFILLFPSIIYSQPPCPPFSVCWCANHPTHPACRDIGIPISDWYGHMILLIAGTLLVYLQIRKTNKQHENK